MGERRIIEPGSAIIASAIVDAYPSVKPYAADTFHVRKGLSLTAAAAAVDTVSVWQLPVGRNFTIEDVWLDFYSASLDGGTKYPLAVVAELVGAGGRVRGISKATLPSARFAAGSPGSMDFAKWPSVFGLRGWSPLDVASHAEPQQESLLHAYGGLLQAKCDSATDVFNTQFAHGMIADDPCFLHATNPDGQTAGTIPTDPGSIDSGTLLYARAVSDPQLFSLALTPGGAPVNFSSNGTNPFFIEPRDLAVGNGRMFCAAGGNWDGATLRVRATTANASAGTWVIGLTVNVVGRIIVESA